MLSKEQFEKYSKEYYNSVYKYCMYRLENKEDAEDITQDTFLIFSQKYHLIEDEKYVKAWLYDTAHNLILREFKKRQRKINKESVFDEDLLEGSIKCRRFEDDVVSLYGEKYENDVYESLSEKDKEDYELFTDGTIKPGEIAKLLNLEGHASSMRRKRLKERCREILSEILFY